VRRAWVGTDQHVEVPGHVNRIPDFDPRSGDHLWTMGGCWRVDPEKVVGGSDVDGPPLLDTENLLALVGPGCFYCETEYTPLLATRRCKGGP